MGDKSSIETSLNMKGSEIELKMEDCDDEEDTNVMRKVITLL